MRCIKYVIYRYYGTENKLSNIFIQTKFPEKRKRKIKIIFDNQSNDDIPDYDSIKLYRIQVFRTIIDKLNMTIENKFLKNNK